MVFQQSLKPWRPQMFRGGPPNSSPISGVQGRASASFPEADTEAGVPPADEELPEQTEQVVGQAEAPETSPIPVNTPESLRAQRAVQTVDIPEKTYKMSFLDESGRFIDPAKVSITGDIMKFTMQGALTKVGAVATNNVGTTKQNDGAESSFVWGYSHKEL